MAALDDLLERVQDSALRADLEREIAPLRTDQSLGLVFERHLPERVRLYGQPIRRGLTVQVESDPERTDWRVVRVRDDVAELQRRTQDGITTDQRPLAELVVVREFGDPIYPGLASLGRVERGGDKAFHTVIEGENYHALETLLLTCEGQVDAIFIDPPYNTGARDWKYNNDYVDADDNYRHSKWLAMMERRLEAAKRLMNPRESVLIVSIDENELHRLALLIERIFPSSKVQMVTALINPAGASIIDQFSRVDEQLLFVHVGAARPIRTVTDTTPGTSTLSDADGRVKRFGWEPFQRSGGNSRREDTKAKFFPVYIDESAGCIAGCGDSLALGADRARAPDPPAGCVQQWPIKSDGTEGCWQLSPETFRQYLSEGRVRLGRRNARTGRWGLSFLTKGHMRAIESGELVVAGRDANGALVVENAEGRVRTRIGKTIWTNGAFSATEHGSTLLRKLLPGRRFPFPKSLYLVEDALRYYVGDKPDALVLDFFAGSGTTGHAVMRLNREDGGRRRSILVTNNEVSEKEAASLAAAGHRPTDGAWRSLGIFEFVTRPRLTAAISGRTPEGEPISGDYRFVDPFPMADGFEENVEFLRLTYEDRDSVELGRAFPALSPLLWLKAGAQGPRVETAEDVWAVPDGGRYGVLFDADRWQGFAEAVRASSTLTHAFVATDSDAVFQRIVAELPSEVRCFRLYDSYLRLFELGGGGRR